MTLTVLDFAMPRKTCQVAAGEATTGPDGPTEVLTMTAARAEETSTHAPLFTLRLAVRQPASSASTSIGDIEMPVLKLLRSRAVSLETIAINARRAGYSSDGSRRAVL